MDVIIDVGLVSVGWPAAVGGLVSIGGVGSVIFFPLFYGVEWDGMYSVWI